MNIIKEQKNYFKYKQLSKYLIEKIEKRGTVPLKSFFLITKGKKYKYYIIEILINSVSTEWIHFMSIEQAEIMEYEIRQRYFHIENHQIFNLSSKNVVIEAVVVVCRFCSLSIAR